MLEENKFSFRALLHGKDAEWYFARGLDDITAAGSYEVRLFHDDMETLGITTADCDKEHYVVAHLFVSESAATGRQQALRVVGQTLLLTICATNAVKAFTRTCETTPKGASWGSWVDLGAASTTDIQDGSITAQKLSRDIRPNAESPLRPLFIEAGAEYNAETGFYSLNGVDDLSESDISVCYAYKEIAYNLDKGRLAQGLKSLRAVYPYRYPVLADAYNKSGVLEGVHIFRDSSLEFFRLNTSISIDEARSAFCLPCNTLEGTFADCKKLRMIYPINVSKLSKITGAFTNCENLLELRLFGLKCGLLLTESPLISKGSIIYIVRHAAPSSVITITLHPDAYARLADDADVVAALEAQPLVSLVSA